jgi:hypothetical protein
VTAANTWADLVSQIGTLAAAAYTTVQSAELVYGLLRKVAMWLRPQS